MKTSLHLLLLLPLATPSLAQDGIAVYKIELDETWSATTHPGAYPKFGGLLTNFIGASHNSSLSLWQVGALASDGMESMAEASGPGALAVQIYTAIDAGDAEQLIYHPFGVPVEVTVTDETPLVTLVSRIFPSPDWFVGVHDLNLYEGGSWVASKTVELYAYDAGTDSGTDFYSPNLDTDPQDPITLMTGGPFFGTTPLGTLEFTRLASVEPYGCGLNPAGSLTSDEPPHVGELLTFFVDDPTGSMGVPSTPLLAVSALAVPAYPCGILVPGLGMVPGTDGELLLVVPPIIESGADWSGSPVSVSVQVPDTPTMVGTTFIAQGGLLDLAAGRAGLTQGARCWVGP
ncbi:MAG: spondin domain-containing protein [Planctomycetota bacterium]